MTTTALRASRRPAGGTAATITALLQTELLKLCSVRAPVVLTAAGPILTAGLALQAVAQSGKAGAPSVGTAALLLAVLSTAAYAQLSALVVGVLAVTSERRHGTLTATLLQTPHRLRLICAKAVAAALAGLLTGLLSLAVVLLVATAAGAVRAPLVNADVVLAALGQLLAYPLYALLGVAVGTLLCEWQPIAVLLPVAWFLLLEDYLGALAHEAARWLPGRLASALANAGQIPDLVPVWAGGLGLLGYGLLVLGAGALRFDRTDVG